MKKMKIHELKIEPKYMIEKIKGNKPWEIRKNDRDFKVGDLLFLRVWNGEKYTGHEMYQTVDYIFSDAEYLQNGYVILSGRLMDKNEVHHLIDCKFTADEIKLIQATLMGCNDQLPVEIVMRSVSSINEKLELMKEMVL